MIKKKIILVSGVALLSLGMTACQNNSQNTTSQSTIQSSKKSISPDITNNTSSSKNEESSSEVSSSSITSSSTSSNSQESQTSSSEQSDQSSSLKSHNKKAHLPGDEGLYIFPASYQGTWYMVNEDDEISTLTINGATIAHGNDESFQIHKVDEDKLPASPSIALQKKAANKGVGKEAEVNGRKYINVKTYFQSAGAGAWYGLHTEEGQPVLVQGSGAEALIDSVYWKTPELAKKYADEKFDDLNYN